MPGYYRRVAAVSGREARLALWAEALAHLAPLAAAQEFEEVVQKTWFGEAAALAAYLPLLDLPTIAARAGQGRAAAVLTAAREADLEGCLLLLEDPGSQPSAETLGPPPDPILDSLTLGQRKTAARGLRNPLLERILKDADPLVVREVLRNPRLRESEVVTIASRRPCPEEVFWALVRSERWIRRPAVRRAIVLNPRAPSRLAVSLLPTLSLADVGEVACWESLSLCLREPARELLVWRARR